MTKKRFIVAFCAVVFSALFVFSVFKLDSFKFVSVKDQVSKPSFTEIHRKLTGTRLDSSVEFLKNAKSAKIVNFTNYDDKKFGNVNFLDYEKDSMPLSKENIDDFSDILYLDQNFFPTESEGLQPVKFCAFMPTYGLMFDMEDYKIQYILCFDCSDVFINILKDEKYYSSPKLAFSSPSRDFFEETLSLNSK